jgi:Transglycosylase-like domain
MDTPRFHPLRVAISSLLVAVMIPTIALADARAPLPHRSSSPKYQVVANYVDLTVLLERNSMHTPSAMQAERAQRLERRYERERRRRRRQAKLEAERLSGVPAPQPTAAAAPASHAAAPATSASIDWDAIASCESGGRWSLNSGNGFWGGLQFTPGTWFAYGGGPFNGAGAFPYSRSAQIAVAERVLAAQGVGAWPYCGRYG